MAFHSGNYHNGISGLQLIYLDAGFPFIDGFPLLPHLSHNDGRKIDLAFPYRTKAGAAVDANPSLLGYGVYVEPLDPKIRQAQNCKDAEFWQYDYTKYLGFNINKDLTIDEALTKFMTDDKLQFLPAEKIFIEPHLIPRLELDRLSSHQRSKIRCHGCQAVRYDDQFHVQTPKDY
jgi:hypothetical protein